VLKYLILCLLIVSTSLTKGQYRFQNINTQHGLSHNSVNNVYKDSKGYYWISTNDGLNQYNGYEFKQFRKNSKINNSISDNFVLQVIEDANRQIWVATRHCLNRYNTQTRDFNNVNRKTLGGIYKEHNAIYKLMFDNDSNLYYQIGPNFYKISKNEFNKNEPHQDTLSKYGVNDYYLLQNRGLHFAIRNQYNIIGKYGNSLSPEYSIRIPFDSTNNQYILYANQHIAIYLHCNKLYVIDVSKNKIEEIKLSIGELSPSAFKMFGKDEFFIGSEQGLFIFNLKTKALKRISYCDKHKKEEPVISISITSDSILWIGTSGQGVFYADIKKTNSRFINSKIFEELESDKFNCTHPYNNKVYAGTTNGLVVSNFKLDTFELRFKGVNISDITQDQKNNFWFATTQGIWKCDKNLNLIKKFEVKDGLLKTNKIFDLHYVSSKNEIWAGTYCGLYKIDCDTYKAVSYQLGKELISGYILGVSEDRQGNIWISHTSGISKYLPITNSFKNIEFSSSDKCSLSHRICTFLYEDNQGYWIGTLGGGLNFFTNSDSCFKHFGSYNGFNSDMVSGITPEINGYRWIATYNGLVKFKLKDATTKNFTINNGLICNEIGINGIKTINNELFLCTPLGLNIIPIDELVKPKSIKKPNLEALIIDGVEQKIDSESIFLTNNRNHLVVKLHYPNLIEQNTLCYQYKFKKENTPYETLPLGTKQLLLDNIGYGKHIIDIRMFDPSSGTTSNSLYITIINKPPFYKTTLFWFILAFITLVVTVAILFLNQKAKHRNEMKRMEMEKNLYLQKEMISKDLHDNIGSQLTYIIRNLDLLEQDLIDKRISPESINELGTIARSTVQQLRDTIWATHNSHVTIEEFWHRVKSYLVNYLASEKQIQISSNLKGNGKVIINATILLQLFRIIQEAANNIVKHSKATNVEVNFEQVEGILRIIINDNGNGFIIENKEEQYGLKNMKERTLFLNGHFEINSKINSGTFININIPI